MYSESGGMGGGGGGERKRAHEREREREREREQLYTANLHVWARVHLHFYNSPHFICYPHPATYYIDEGWFSDTEPPLRCWPRSERGRGEKRQKSRRSCWRRKLTRTRSRMKQ